MNLSQSILESLLVCLVFWGLALFQSEAAQAFSIETTNNKSTIIKSKNKLNEAQATIETSKNIDKNSEKLPVEKINNSKTKRVFNISGLTQHQPLNQINRFWQKFNESDHLHKRLNKQPKVVYVLYKNFSNNYQEATITIGYDLSILSMVTDKIEINLNNYNTILPRKSYLNEQIIKGWEKINFNQGVESVLEIHHLGITNQPESAQLLAAYK